MSVQQRCEIQALGRTTADLLLRVGPRVRQDGVGQRAQGGQEECGPAFFCGWNRFGHEKIPDSFGAHDTEVRLTVVYFNFKTIFSDFSRAPLERMKIWQNHLAGKSIELIERKLQESRCQKKRSRF